MAIMTYEKWYELTHERLNWRGSELKAVDNALIEYHKNPNSKTAFAIKTALRAYIKYLGGKEEAKKYSRNSKGGIITLEWEVNTYAYCVEHPAAAEFRELLAQRRDELWSEYFLHKKIVLRSSQAINAIKDPATLIYQYTKLDKALRPPLPQPPSAIQQQATEFLSKIIESVVPANKVQEILSALGAEYIKSFAKAVTPYVSVGFAIVSVALNVKTIIQSIIAARDAQEHKLYIAQTRDALRAVDALSQSLRDLAGREGEKLAFNALNAAIQGATFAMPPGVGAVTGLASSFANTLAIFILDVTNLALDLRHVSCANGILAEPTKLFNVRHRERLFKTWPLVGAYFILLSHDLDLLAYIGQPIIGTPDWKEVLQNLSELHIKPLKESARDVVLSSRFTLENLYVVPKGVIESMANWQDTLVAKWGSMVENTVLSGIEEDFKRFDALAKDNDDAPSAPSDGEFFSIVP